MRQNAISAEKIREQHELEALQGLPSLKKTAVGRPTTTTSTVGRPTTTTSTVGRPTTATTLTRVHPHGSTGITKRPLLPPRRTTPGLLLDKLANKHRDHVRADIFGQHNWTTDESVANRAYHEAEAKALRAMSEAFEIIRIINGIEIPAITKDTVNKHEKHETRKKYRAILFIVREYLVDAINYFSNAIDGRRYTCNTFYGGIMDSRHRNAIALINCEIANVNRYIDHIDPIIDAITDLTVEKSEINTYVFASPKLAVSEKKTLMFPAKCYPTNFLEQLERSSIAVG